MTTLPDWINDPVLRPAWERIRARFEKAGLEARGIVSVQAATRAERHALGALLGSSLTRESVRVDLATLDSRLRERSGAGGLEAVLTAVLGTPPQDRIAARTARDDARERPLALAAELVTAPWAADWIAGLRRTGVLTSRDNAERVVAEAATVLREVTGSGGDLVTRSRVEISARLFGDSHALDRDRLLHQIVLRGLAAAAGSTVPDGAREREQLWASYGVEPDLLSRTCLVFRLRLAGSTPVAQRLDAAADAGDPAHVTEWDLRRVDSVGSLVGTRVLVCENPRVVEALAEREVSTWAAVCTSGEPNLVVDKLLSLLSDAGAELYYHGDFDWPGIAIANRVIGRFGAIPWRMSADDYIESVRPDGRLLAGAPVTPSWDAELGAAMRVHGRAVHEESVLASLIDELLGSAESDS